MILLTAFCTEVELPSSLYEYLCLSFAELTAVYKVLQRKYDYITAEPFILYGRITSLLGEFPTYEKTPPF